MLQCDNQFKEKSDENIVKFDKKNLGDQNLLHGIPYLLKNKI